MANEEGGGYEAAVAPYCGGEGHLGRRRFPEKAVANGADGVDEVARDFIIAVFFLKVMKEEICFAAPLFQTGVDGCYIP